MLGVYKQYHLMQEKTGGGGEREGGGKGRNGVGDKKENSAKKHFFFSLCLVQPVKPESVEEG